MLGCFVLVYRGECVPGVNGAEWRKMMERMMERTAYSKMENEGDRKTERPVERSIKRRFGKRMAGMLKTGLLFLPVLCLEGCAEAIPAGLGDSSLDGLSERSSCFYLLCFRVR